MLTKTRRLLPVLLAGLLLVPSAGPASAIDGATAEPPTSAILAQAELDLVTLTNSKRVARDLIRLRIDPDLMRIARDRAEASAPTASPRRYGPPRTARAAARLRRAGSASA